MGQTLATEAIAECVIQPAKKRELRQHWQRACKLILANAEVLAVSRAPSRSPTRRETRKEEVSDVRKNRTICHSGRASDMIEPGQIIFMVMAIIALAALASMPSWWTAILLVGILGGWAFSGLWKKVLGRADAP